MSVSPLTPRSQATLIDEIFRLRKEVEEEIDLWLSIRKQIDAPSLPRNRRVEPVQECDSTMSPDLRLTLVARLYTHSLNKEKMQNILRQKIVHFCEQNGNRQDLVRRIHPDDEYLQRLYLKTIESI
jgi:hypothetical protein